MSQNFKIQANYSILAKYYDLLLQDEESLVNWFKYIDNKEYQTVLELASGSALLASILLKNGKDIIASDFSKDMQETAKNRFNGEYRIIDMKHFNIEETFDLVLCVCDSINYLKPQELESCFKSVFACLNKGGRFIFDMHNIHRLIEFKEEYIEEGSIEDINYQWTILTDLYDQSLDEIFTFYTYDGIIQENHHQYIFKADFVINVLKEIGFEVEYIEDFIEEEKDLFIAYKNI